MFSILELFKKKKAKNTVSKESAVKNDILNAKIEQ